MRRSPIITKALVTSTLTVLSASVLSHAAGPVVGISQNTNYAKAVREAIELAGGLKGVIKPGNTVFIKPNIVGARPPASGVITDYRVVSEVVAMAKEAGAKRIIIGEHTNPDDTELALEVSKIGSLKGVEFLDTNTPPETSVKKKAPLSLSGVEYVVPKPWLDADVVISVPVMKTHDIGGVTLSLKNIGIGLPPIRVYGQAAGWKSDLHDIGVAKTIVDMNQIRQTNFSVIDAMVAGEGNGPGNPDPVKMNVVIAGRDPVAVDTVGTSVMGIDPNLITHIVYSQGVGTGTMEGIQVKGKSIEQVKKKLKRAPDSVYPYKMTTYAKAVPSAYKMDGSLTEWQGTRQATVATDWQVLGGSDAWSGPKDASGNFSIAYREGELVVAGSITDDRIVTGRDGVKVSLSFNNPFEPDKNKSRKKINEKLDFILSAQVAAEKEGTVPLSTPKGQQIGSVVFKPSSGGYSFEATIPTVDLGQKLTFAQEFWVDFGIVDVDDQAADSSETTLYWAGPGAKGTNPSSWGRAVSLVK